MQLPSTVQLPRRTFQIPAHHIGVANSVQTALWHCVYTAKYIIHTYFGFYWHAILWMCTQRTWKHVYCNTNANQYAIRWHQNIHSFYTILYYTILYHKTKTTTTNNVQIMRKSFEHTWHTTHSLFHSSRLWCDPLCHLHKCNKQLVQRSHSSTNLPSPWDVMKLRRATLGATW